MATWKYKIDADPEGEARVALHLIYADDNLDKVWHVRWALLKLMWAGFTMMRPGK